MKPVRLSLAGRAVSRELAELVHNAVAHPLLGVTRFAAFVARSLERAALRFHEATAERAWPEDEEEPAETD